MTFEQIAAMVKSMGFPYAYYEFDEGSGQQPPFICFYYPNNDDFMADGSNYVQITALNIELYTDEKDFDAEAKVESVLKDHGLTFSKSETKIDSEHMYQIIYEMEVIINGKE